MKDHFIQRCIFFTAGLFIMSFGVVLSVKADLGVSPISCIPYVLSLSFPVSLGMATIGFNILLIIFQVVILRRNYRLFQLIQLPVVFLFGIFIDINVAILSNWHVSGYMWKVFFCTASCAVLALGVFMEVKAKITYLPGEGLAIAISDTFNSEFGKCKIFVDSAMVIIGIISSFILLNNLQGIREGTIASALLVGYMARFYDKKFRQLRAIADKKAQSIQIDPVKSDKTPFVITISREFGSGGHEIGQLVARKLGISFYDKDLIKRTSEKSGFTEEYVSSHEQKLANSLLHSLYEQNYAYADEKMPPADTLFLVQTKIIREIAFEESCVIVGRCADFILKDHPLCFRIFIYASYDSRKKQIMQRLNVNTSDAEKMISEIDHERENYCRYYTGKHWREMNRYDLAVNSSLFDYQSIAQIIAEAAEKYISIR